jgi:hypothetical protein
MEGALGIIGMDIHRVTAEVVSLLGGEIVKIGRFLMLRDRLEETARKELTHDANSRWRKNSVAGHIPPITSSNHSEFHLGRTKPCQFALKYPAPSGITPTTPS